MRGPELVRVEVVEARPGGEPERWTAEQIMDAADDDDGALLGEEFWRSLIGDRPPKSIVGHVPPRGEPSEEAVEVARERIDLFLAYVSTSTGPDDHPLDDPVEGARQALGVLREAQALLADAVSSKEGTDG